MSDLEMPQMTKKIDNESIKTEAAEWYLLKSEGALSEDEEREFESWINRDENHAEVYYEVSTLWSALGEIDQNQINPKLKQAGFLEQIRLLLERVKVSSRKKPLKVRKYASALSIAALLTIGLVSLGVFESNQNKSASSFNNKSQTFQTDLGEVKTIKLRDGSTLTLGASSEVEVVFDSESRAVRLLNGDAIFDVVTETSRPFTVSAQKFKASVLGTVFDIRNNGDMVRLSVLEGKVETSHPLMVNEKSVSTINKQVLAAGEQIYAHKDIGLSSAFPFRENQFATWRNGRLTYSNVSLTELISDANRYSNDLLVLSADAADLENANVVISFDVKDIETLISTLPIIFPVVVDIQADGTIMIEKK
ncbi:MAG: FecR domain-containing protein [Pseudomonadota bacterium]